MEAAEILVPKLIEGDVARYERERGKPMPSKRHAVLQPRLAAILFSFRNVTILTELNFIIDEKKYVPDICVYTADASDWHEEEMNMTIPPLLTVEILSPAQDLNDLISKAEAYLVGGVKAAWIVHSRLEAIIVLCPDEKPRFYSDGTLTDAATGISIDVQAVFR